AYYLKMPLKSSQFLCLFVSVLTLSLNADEPIVKMLVPGFSVQELPLKISNLNNLRFSIDGTLTALGYDGRVHLLRDTNDDGVEDIDELFWDKSTITVPVGMAWSTNGLYVSSHGKVSLLRDTNSDGKADEEEIIASGWPPTDVGSGGVDASALTIDPQGNLYFGLLTQDYSNPYRVKDGVSHYDVNGMRGTIQKWNANTKKLETIATGIRVPYTLAFNKAGDLFNTDQEGETWCPNGNPLDELNHIVLGKNYGFPPRDDKWLTNLVSVPPVVGFGPQHQSTCGLIFNEPEPRGKNSPGRALFGPQWWEGDAFVAGESRGKIWRVKLVKTPGGYVGREFMIARLSMLTMDVAISPKGDLYVCCHSGKPDWGTGPKGEGKIFKISYSGKSEPQPVAAWASGQGEVRVGFDRPVDSSITNNLGGQEIEFGEFVSAADRFEVIRPSYKVVELQQQTPRGKLKIFSATLENNQQTLVLSTAPHPLAAKYALTISNVKAKGNHGEGATVDVDYDLRGVQSVVSKKSPVDVEWVKDFHPAWLPAHQPQMILPKENPELAGGDFQRGKNLFFGDRLKCATCHRIRGEGKLVAPDLSNLASRDVGSILRDIKEPSATINPDYVAFNVFLKSGEDLAGFIRAQKGDALTVLGVDGKESVIAQKDVKELRASAVSLMPAGLLDGLNGGEIRDLLIFLSSEPPHRKTGEVQRVLRPEQGTLQSNSLAQNPALRDLKIVWVASKQDHGPGEHDYPAAQKSWVSLLNQAQGVSATNAWEWPDDDQFSEADVLVFYFWNHNWSEARLNQVDDFLARGGGLVVLHSATISDNDPERLAQTIGLASHPKRSKYLHTPLDLKFTETKSPITERFPKQINFLDEPYWPLIGDTNKIAVLATVKMEGTDWPEVWTLEKGKSRVFGSVIGHYTWTQEDSLYRVMVLRALAWVAGQPVNRLEKLAASKSADN
ncbi:MAG: ThuA domain-containing protein, partial [Verrucomicrobiota bacterium]